MKYICPFCYKTKPEGYEPSAWSCCGEVGHAAVMPECPKCGAEDFDMHWLVDACQVCGFSSPLTPTTDENELKEIKFSTANHPDQWWAADYGGVIKFASADDAKAAEALFETQAIKFAEYQAEMVRDFSKDCAALARYIRHDAPKHVKDIALGWLEDDERETP